MIFTTTHLLFSAFATLALVSSVLTQIVDENNPDVKAAIFHAAGNSTKVQSDIVITSPTQDSVWYTQSHNTITWTGSTPSEFAVMIVYKNPSSRASGISLIANQQTSSWSVDTRIGKIESGKYFVRLYNPQDTTKEIAVSAEFTIDLKKNKPQASNGTSTSNGITSSSSSPTSIVNSNSSVANTSQSPTGLNGSFQQAASGKANASSAALSYAKTASHLRLCMALMVILLTIALYI